MSRCASSRTPIGGAARRGWNAWALAASLSVPVACSQPTDAPPLVAPDPPQEAARALPWPVVGEAPVTGERSAAFGARVVQPMPLHATLRVRLDHAHGEREVFAVEHPESSERWIATPEGVRLADGPWLWRADELRGEAASDEREIHWTDDCVRVTYAARDAETAWRSERIEESRRFCVGGELGRDVTWSYGEGILRRVRWSSAGAGEASGAGSGSGGAR